MIATTKRFQVVKPSWFNRERARHHELCYRRFMGLWGIQPWENDAAADWLDQLAEKTRLSDRIESALRLPLEHIDEIRAAAFLLLQLGEAGTWLVDQPDRLAMLAIERLTEAVESNLYTNPEIRRLILAELTQLRTLLTTETSREEETDPVGNKLSRIASEQFGLTQYDVIDVEGNLVETRLGDVVGTGSRDADGVLHLQLEDDRTNGFLLKCRCVPDDNNQFD